MRRLIGLVVVLFLALGGSPVAGQGEGPWWVVPPEDNRDLPPGLIPYHEIAPRLKAIAARSERVRVEVIGQSAQGRDLYLVTVSDPSAFGRLGRYKALRQLMIEDPARAQRMAAEFRDFKVPFFVNASIHGNEWEGVDASIRLIERLAFADDPETRRVLDSTILLFNVVQNPDGRVLGQRRNGNGFDLNRDFITLSQPETRATVEQLVEWHPMVLLDLHGYVDPMLIEPTTPPHNPNYEYDLYIRWALRQAEAMEAELAEQTGLSAVIPFRDWEDGWDDWPPIFTPMYAMYHGAYGHTLESPLRVNGSAVSLPPHERRERAETNVAAHTATVWGALQFVADNRLDMIHDQIEVFRRGWLDEPQVPIGDEHGEEHEFLAEFPEAYVIPTGERQRSEIAAARLVNHLLDNDVIVERATRPFAVGGATYPAGSFVVPMAQPKRGLANTILEPGYDITEVVPVMYDISGWSNGELWGASVVAVPNGTPVSVERAPVSGEQRADGRVEPGSAAFYGTEVETPAEVRAVNSLLDLGVPLHRARDGRVFAPAAAKPALQRHASEAGLVFEAEPGLPAGTERMRALRVAAAVSDDEHFVLTRLGFRVDRVTEALLNSGWQLDAHDVLVVSSGLSWSRLSDAARAEVTAFLAASGGGLVTRGATGARFNRDAGVLPLGFVLGNGDANGIADVANAADSPVLGAYPPDDVTFVYSPLWFTGLGDGVRVDQRFDGGDFVVSGHWAGQEDAAGQAAVVSGVDETGARAVLFGTEPMFRAHPEGLFAQAAHALYWTGAG